MTYTINPNAKNVWIRDNEDTMDLSPITDASSVYLENGRTIEQELGEGSMVSNIATVDTSMSKIIDGTLDGAYESGVFKGRTLVNLSNLHVAFNNVTLEDYYEQVTLCEVSKLKPNTTYTLFYYIEVLGGDHDIYDRMEYGVSNQLHHVEAHPSTDTDNFRAIIVKNGWTKTSIKFTDFKGYKYLTIRPIRCNAPESGKSITFNIKGFILLEGDWSNKDLPFNDYFEGICDVKMPILRNVGKNLLELNDTALVKTAGTNNLPLTKKNGGLLAKKDSCVKGSAVIYIEIPNAVKGRKYQFSATITSTNMNRALSFYGGNTAFSLLVNNNGRGDGSRVVSDICTFNPSWDKFCIVIGDHGTLIEGANISIEISDLCVWEVDTKQTSMPYEPYKTNILHTPEIVTLRSLPNGVRDELNLKTGEYVKRIGEVVLDGSESWEQNVFSDTIARFVYKPSNKTSNNPRAIISDKFPSNSDTIMQESIFQYTNEGIVVAIERVRLSQENVEGFKQYLSQNPITVQYELAEPITTKVTLTQSEPIVKIGTELPNGVCDTYNLLTGEHIQRVKKVVLNGSENWKIGTVKTVTQVFELVVNDLDIKTKRNNLVCDSLPISNGDSSDTEKIASNDSTGASGKTSSLYMALLKTKASTVEQLKTYLASNPITVWYGLKSPIVTKKNGLPNTYGITLPNGVRDSYNDSTGVYTQNIGKITFDGGEDWRQNQEGSYGFYCYHNESKVSSSFNCKELDTITGWNDYTQKGIFKGSVAWGVVVKSTDLTSCTVEAFKAWLKQNPITVEYEMVTPKTIDIPLINVGQVLPNGVCDTYNPITKEYVKRVSGTVLVGNEDWSLMNSPYETDCIGFETPCPLANWTQSQANLNIVCEGYVGNYELWNVDEEGFSVFKAPTRLAIKVKRSKLSTADINGFKKFLKLNPLAVWYELATPEVSTVDLDLSTLYSSSPIAYENGHIILESGHDGQSLLPTLEYSTVTNRVKQIENIGEQVLRQEKQLTMLEQMLIKGIIGIDYNNTVLTLNLEIDEVM